MNSKKKSVYMVYSPYHLLISLGLATSQDSCFDKYLILKSNYNTSHIFKILKSWKKNPFRKTFFLDGSYNIKNRFDVFSKILLTKKNLKILRRLYLSYFVGYDVDLFVFQDSILESQFLEFLNHQHGNKNFYVEDGAASYSVIDYKTNLNGFLMYLLTKILFGFWYRRLRVFGTYKYTHRIMAFYPQYVRPEIKSKQILKIPTNLFSFIDDSLIELFINEYGLSNEILTSDIIFLVPHSDFIKHFAGDLAYKSYYNLFYMLKERFNKVIVKYHPREKEKDFLHVCDKDGFFCVDNSLPAEILFLSRRNNPPKFIIGDYSTTLLSARTIFGGKTKIISLIKLFNFNDPYLEKAFLGLNVYLPRSFDELKEIIVK